MDIPTAYFGVNNFDEYLHMLDICTQITGKRENYQTYGLDVKAQIEAAKAMIKEPAPTALFIRVGGTTCNVKGSKGTVLGEMLKDLGVENIADSDKSLLENLSIEQIMKNDPQYIFIIFQGSNTEAARKNLEDTLLSNPAWDSLTAVSEGRYHIMDKALYHLKPNAKWGTAYEELAALLYGNE
ncbi:MAG: ABC transporter substrate-binding protein [Firmicutes bacterium]|nr:ABC transporter substrate-binding protein [Bacillota bacterium]